MAVHGHADLFYNVAKCAPKDAATPPRPLLILLLTCRTINPDLLVIDTDGCCWVGGSNASEYSKTEGSIDGGEVCGAGSPYGAAHSAGQCERNTNDFMTPFYGYTTPYIYPLM